MKKTISPILMAAVLFACIPVFAAEIPAGEQAFPEITVMSQVAALDESAWSGWFDEKYNAVLQYGGRFYRVIAKVDEAALEEFHAILGAISYDDPASFAETDAQTDVLGLSLPVDRVEDITGAVKSPEELAATAGMTFAQLEQEDYRYAGEMIRDDGAVILTMNNGLFTYDFEINESADVYSALSENGDLSTLTVKSASFIGISPNALDLRYHADGTHDPIGDADLEVSLDDDEILDILFNGAPEDAG